MAGFGTAQIEKHIKKLQDHGYTIAVYTQDSPSKNTTRSLNTIFSPGTYFSNDSKSLSNNITCIWFYYSSLKLLSENQIHIGIANIDIYTGKTSIFEFSKEYHHNPTTYDELERYISIYNPNECIIVSNLEDSIINDIINFVSINSSKIHKIYLQLDTDVSKLANNAEKQTYQQEVLRKFYAVNDNTLFHSLQSYCIAIQAFVYLLDFVYKHNPNLINNIEQPLIENYTDRLVLANHSLKQLNMIQDNRYMGKYSCVSNLLNNCITSMGKRHFLYNLLNPTTNKEILNESYDITGHLLKNKTWINYRVDLGDIRDIEKLRRKLIMKKITPKDFTILHNNFAVLSNIYKFCKKDKILMKYFNVYKISNIDNLCKEYNVEIERILIFRKQGI